MDAKLNHSDLSTLLAQKGNLPVSKAEQFSKAFFDIIIEGLESDSIVKINGLGTFKMVDVASRSSVNVNTGEKIEIKGHKKMSFIPADALKEKINEPLSQLVPEELDDDYVDDEEVDDEDVENDDIQDDAAVENDEAEDDENDVAAPCGPIENADEPADDGCCENAVEDGVENTEEPAESSLTPAAEEHLPEVEDAHEEDESGEQQLETEPKAGVNVVSEPVEVKNGDGKKRKTPALLYITLLIIAGAAISLFYMKGEQSAEKTAAKVDEKIDKKAITSSESVKSEDVDVNENIISPVVETAVEPQVNDSIAQRPFVMLEQLAERPLKTISIADTLDYKAYGDIAVHVVAADETLTKIAAKYYGDKRLWPYIVKHNGMERPNDLEKGMQLRIPNLQLPNGDE